MPLLEFPNGDAVNVEFDAGSHTYQIQHRLADGSFTDFRPTHGITAPLATIPKPYLKKWAAKMSANATLEHFLDHPEDVDILPQFFQDLKDYEEVTLDENGKKVMTYYRFSKNYPWYKEVKAAAEKKSKGAADQGTWLHSAIEHYYNSDRKELPILTPDVQDMWESFIAFDNFFKPDVTETEFTVYSMRFGYSGQGDVKGRMSGKSVIGDWKTTNRNFANADGISVEYFFQLGGLAQAEFERTGVWVDDVFIANIPKGGGEPRVIFASEFGMSPQDCARAYIACFNLYHVIQEWDYKFKSK